MRPPWKALSLLAGVLMRDRSKGGHVTTVAGVRGTRPRGPERLQPSTTVAQGSPMSPNFYVCVLGRGAHCFSSTISKRPKHTPRQPQALEARASRPGLQTAVPEGSPPRKPCGPER